MFFWLLSSFLYAQVKTVVLYPGHQETVSIANSPRINVEHKDIVRLRDHGRRLDLIGLKTGHTKIVLSSQTIDVHVVRRNTFKTYQHLLTWQNEKLGPTLTIDGDEITIGGKILTFRDWLELLRSMHTQDQFSIEARVSSELQKQINQHIGALLKSHQLPHTEIIFSGRWKMYLSNVQKIEIENYKKLLNPLGIAVATSRFSLSGTPMIEINIVAAEVNKSHMTQLGVRWPAQTAIAPFSDTLLNSASWQLAIDHLESNGWGKVLASPTLVAQSGDEATFHSGGEFPIRSSNQYNSSVTWKKYGILLKIKPLADFSGKIDVVVDCEVSLVDFSQLIDGAPTIHVNKITSRFNLAESRTIALSGLIREEWGRSKSGLPSIQNIPLLGALLGSENYTNNKSELVFFVTPRIVQ